MNLQQMKYAVTIAEIRSLNKAAKQLYVGQPALSRAIKDLETELGIQLFERSNRGMRLTPEGDTFVRYARTVLDQVSSIETMFQNHTDKKERFSISVPRASYIAAAFSRFMERLQEDKKYEIFYQETNSQQAVVNILKRGYPLGIIRYARQYDDSYREMLREKNLAYELVSEFRYLLLFHRDSSLAKLDTITKQDLCEKIEIAHADPYVPSLPLSEVMKDELTISTDRRVFVFERASQLELLASNPDTYMWVSPMPSSVLERYQLIQREAPFHKKIYKDVMIRRKDYKLTELDKLFLEQLIQTKREFLG